MCKHEEMKKKKQQKTKTHTQQQKHDPQVGNFFEFLGRVYSSPVLLIWKESLEGEFVSNMFT